MDAIREGLGLLSWTQDSFAYAEDFDEESGRYRGLRIGQRVSILEDNLMGLLVRPEVALKQHETEKEATEETGTPSEYVQPVTGIAADGQPVDAKTVTPHDTTPEYSGPKRFHGSVTLDSTRVGRDAGRVADEVIAHLVGLVGSDVTVTLEIGAKIDSKTPENVVRIVTENCRTLKFSTHGFEQE